MFDFGTRPLVSEGELLKAKMETESNQFSEKQVIIKALQEFLASNKRKNMLLGQKYYMNVTDIQFKNESENKKTDNSNLKLEHNFAKKLVDQKVGYLVSKLPTISCNENSENEEEKETFQKNINEIFDRKFWRTFQNTTKDAINKGISWLQVYINDGKLKFKKIPSEQVLPLWADDEHTELDGIVRIYSVEKYNITGTKEIINKVEYYRPSRPVEYFIYTNGILEQDMDYFDSNYNGASFIVKEYKTNEITGEKETIKEVPYNWDRVPFIPIKYNEEEQPFVNTIKSLIDNYNLQASIISDILADIPNFIYILKGYNGEDLNEFLNTLKQYKVIAVDNDGDIGSLQSTPQNMATDSVLKQTRANIFDFGRGVDTQSENIGTASGVALKFRFADLDLDCSFLETELQAAFEQILWFVINHAQNAKVLSAHKVSDITITFNRDIIISESDAINDCKNSMGIISNETIIANHPWTKDVQTELDNIKKQEQEEYNDNSIYNMADFGNEENQDF